MNSREKLQMVVLGVTTLCAIAWVAMTEIRIDRIERELKVKHGGTPAVDIQDSTLTAGTYIQLGGRGEL